ncbi:mitochondrial transcription rescue factor 1 [Atheta coriaria]|uniref:mitochondrial transcription rescue factor 1 n=1 Tax=Dalotia coriaria TaxID=877792 RepID=UPI0031F341FC
MLRQLLHSVSTFKPSVNLYNSNNQPIKTILTQRFISKTQINWKKSKKREVESDSEDENTNTYEDTLVDKNSKVLDVKVTNLRLDGILRVGLGLARNKIEVNFYESKIRLNGEKVLKKSESVGIGDEIDVIKGPSPTNPKLLSVARVDVLNITPKDDYISMKLRRCKSLLIENYNDGWKPS